jgi:hypothetical protein
MRVLRESRALNEQVAEYRLSAADTRHQRSIVGYFPLHFGLWPLVNAQYQLLRTFDVIFSREAAPYRSRLHRAARGHTRLHLTARGTTRTHQDALCHAGAARLLAWTPPCPLPSVSTVVEPVNRPGFYLG